MAQLQVGERTYRIWRLDELQSRWDVALLPYTLRILLENVLRNGTEAEVEAVALVLQGSLLLRFSPSAVSDAFVASRLGGDWGRAFGTLPSGVDFEAVLERVLV